MSETERRPALILGTSSDRIGTEDGRSYYATLSKSLERALDLPIAPYAGAAYGESDEEVVAIGGLAIRWSEEISSVQSWDGHNLHHFLSWRFDETQSVGLVLAQQGDDYYLGVTYGLGFALPWED